MLNIQMYQNLYTKLTTFSFKIHIISIFIIIRLCFIYSSESQLQKLQDNSIYPIYDINLNKDVNIIILKKIKNICNYKLKEDHLYHALYSYGYKCIVNIIPKNKLENFKVFKDIKNNKLVKVKYLSNRFSILNSLPIRNDKTLKLIESNEYYHIIQNHSDYLNLFKFNINMVLREVGYIENIIISYCEDLHFLHVNNITRDIVDCNSYNFNFVNNKIDLGYFFEIHAINEKAQHFINRHVIWDMFIWKENQKILKNRLMSDSKRKDLLCFYSFCVHLSDKLNEYKNIYKIKFLIKEINEFLECFKNLIKHNKNILNDLMNHKFLNQEFLNIFDFTIFFDFKNQKTELGEYDKFHNSVMFKDNKTKAIYEIEFVENKTSFKLKNGRLHWLSLKIKKDSKEIDVYNKNFFCLKEKKRVKRILKDIEISIAEKLIFLKISNDYFTFYKFRDCDAFYIKYNLYFYTSINESIIIRISKDKIIVENYLFISPEELKIIKIYTMRFISFIQDRINSYFSKNYGCINKFKSKLKRERELYENIFDLDNKDSKEPKRMINYVFIPGIGIRETKSNNIIEYNLTNLKKFYVLKDKVYYDNTGGQMIATSFQNGDYLMVVNSMSILNDASYSEQNMIFY